MRQRVNQDERDLSEKTIMESRGSAHTSARGQGGAGATDIWVRFKIRLEGHDKRDELGESVDPHEMNASEETGR